MKNKAPEDKELPNQIELERLAWEIAGKYGWKKQDMMSGQKSQILLDELGLTWDDLREIMGYSRRDIQVIEDKADQLRTAYAKDELLVVVQEEPSPSPSAPSTTNGWKSRNKYVPRDNMSSHKWHPIVSIVAIFWTLYALSNCKPVQKSTSNFAKTVERELLP